MGMELLLNSVWAMVALASVCLWLRVGRRSDRDRRTSFVGLVMLIVILFPVISVSDDLWSIQNPAETDSYQRRDHLASCPHSIIPIVAALPEPAFAEFTFGFERPSAPRNPVWLALDNPALQAIQNRPPPVS